MRYLPRTGNHRTSLNRPSRGIGRVGTAGSRRRGAPAAGGQNRWALSAACSRPVVPTPTHCRGTADVTLQRRYGLGAEVAVRSDVVLSACESGLPAVHPGDELLGLAAALLAMGAKSLVATVVPVLDDASRSLMLSLHRRPAWRRCPSDRPRPGTERVRRRQPRGPGCCHRLPLPGSGIAASRAPGRVPARYVQAWTDAGGRRDRCPVPPSRPHRGARPSGRLSRVVEGLSEKGRQIGGRRTLGRCCDRA